MTHPLHPKLIDALSEYKTCPEDMQAAADWQLKQVKLTGQCLINELHENNCHIGADHAAAFLEVLIEAMRPTTKENN